MDLPREFGKTKQPSPSIQAPHQPYSWLASNPPQIHLKPSAINLPGFNPKPSSYQPTYLILTLNPKPTLYQPSTAWRSRVLVIGSRVTFKQKNCRQPTRPSHCPALLTGLLMLVNHMCSGSCTCRYTYRQIM